MNIFFIMCQHHNTSLLLMATLPLANKLIKNNFYVALKYHFNLKYLYLFVNKHTYGWWWWWWW